MVLKTAIYLYTIVYSVVLYFPHALYFGVWCRDLIDDFDTEHPLCLDIILCCTNLINSSFSSNSSASNMIAPA